jgi:hypothetical protein
MKLLLAIVAVVIVFASFYVDYKWRRWIATRRGDHDRQ